MSQAGLRVAVPQKIFTPSSGAIVSTRAHAPPILFTRSRIGKPISVKEAMDLQYAMTIDAPGFVIKSENKYKTFRLYIEWPGYKGLYIHHTMRYDITRAQILMEVAKQIAFVLDRAGHSPCSSKYSQFKVGVNGITINNVYIISLLNTVEDTWQAELEIGF